MNQDGWAWLVVGLILVGAGVLRALHPANLKRGVTLPSYRTWAEGLTLLGLVSSPAEWSSYLFSWEEEAQHTLGKVLILPKSSHGVCSIALVIAFFVLTLRLWEQVCLPGHIAFWMALFWGSMPSVGQMSSLLQFWPGWSPQLCIRYRIQLDTQRGISDGIWKLFGVKVDLWSSQKISIYRVWVVEWLLYFVNLITSY